jgi:hypothetical protein
VTFYALFVSAKCDTLEKEVENSNLLYEFYKTPFCRTRFLEHEERSDECYKENKCDKMAYKTSIIQYSFYFAPKI